jgi:hypothetical protein
VQQLLKGHSERRYDAMKIHGDLSPEIYDALITGGCERGFRIRGHGQHMMPSAQTLRMDCVEHVEELLYVSRAETLGREANFGVEENGYRAWRRTRRQTSDDRKHTLGSKHFGHRCDRRT